jgi:hypothetical protein
MKTPSRVLIAGDHPADAGLIPRERRRADGGPRTAVNRTGRSMLVCFAGN